MIELYLTRNNNETSEAYGKYYPRSNILHGPVTKRWQPSGCHLYYFHIGTKFLILKASLPLCNV